MHPLFEDILGSIAGCLFPLRLTCVEWLNEKKQVGGVKRINERSNSSYDRYSIICTVKKQRMMNCIQFSLFMRFYDYSNRM